MPAKTKTMLLLCLVLACMTGLVAQEKGDAASTIKSLELKWTDAYKHRQLQSLVSLLAEDFIITVEDGSTYGKAGYISHTADSSLHVQVAEMSDLHVRVHGDAAVVIGAYHEKGDSGGKPYEYHDRFTDVWIKIGGVWQVLASHYSVPLK
jgi:ketosteroid isomerase-like protein